MSALLSVENLRVWYPANRKLGELLKGAERKFVKAVDHVSFDINKGETLGIVGESGCGKSTLGRAMLGLEKITEGNVSFHDDSFSKFNQKKWLAFRQSAQMIFQDPFSSLNPRQTIGAALREVLKVHDICKPNERDDKIKELLFDVGLSPELMERYPGTLSGGQCQRIGIARALALSPDIIVADESVSALDVSVQAQILNLFLELKRKKNLALVFISHDLEVVRHVCEKVIVMYLGRVVETGTIEQVFNAPKHPYTRSLLSARPYVGGPALREMSILAGEPPSPLDLPKGCAFNPRCENVMDVCKTGEMPSLIETEAGCAACHLYA